MNRSGSGNSGLPEALRDVLRATARETQLLVRCLQDDVSPVNLASSQRYHLSDLGGLAPVHSPRTAPRIEVCNLDTLDAATNLWRWAWEKGLRNTRPFVLNFANANHRGGGWLNGALAQEEELCRRSSLACSLEHQAYPLRRRGGIYSPNVYTIRESLARNHELMRQPAADLPKCSVFTVAAIKKPRTTQAGRFFSLQQDRSLTKDKMRLALRVAAINHHEMLVLGAFGCGVFSNPPDDIAYCWLEVLREREFANRWKAVAFAVYDRSHAYNPHGNFEIFNRILHGQQV
ncbi:uncharacterized protein MAM_06454 [Metarhizium album ARSEF 1941]|uniref:Microbial-type PARG catalytic domain-containing protein n=1 Tax=Metarhizium album (strain ARSEF 1941) TaxID=1081103 RepID=A0A0B2WNP7_METAS|nr:uncharacterized protein MAM_06454 [Metarhizium album ARSEF 1941]KHN95613.1 hypothetical protein MAM_06454 [Metarhizium album ARSEF 1941]